MRKTKIMKNARVMNKAELMGKAEVIFLALLHKSPHKEQAQAFAPSNIALSKYWGKRDSELNLPCNSSISISLGELGTHTQIKASNKDCVILNGEEISPDSSFARKIWQFVGYFRDICGAEKLEIQTTNNIPTAAGLASSASGFAALTLAANDFWNLSLSDRELSVLARLGSGSAARSLWHGFVKWHRGKISTGLDSYGAPLSQVHENAKKLRLALLKVDTQAKKHSSRDAMLHCAQTSPYFSAWTEAADKDLSEIESAIATGNLSQMLEIAEYNALAMHAAILSSRASVSYLQPRSWELIEQIWQLREQNFPVYFTIDAGPNLKLLYPSDAALEQTITRNFPDALLVNPFGGFTNLGGIA